MISLLIEWSTAILILAGTIFTFLSAVGLIRLPDVYSRAHAASKSATLGVLFTLLGVFLFFLMEEGYFSTKLFLGFAGPLTVQKWKCANPVFKMI